MPLTQLPVIQIHTTSRSMLDNYNSQLQLFYYYFADQLHANAHGKNEYRRQENRKESMEML